MENETNVLEPLIEKAQVYTQTSLELFKLKSIDKTSNILSTFIARAAVFIPLSLFIIIANIGLSLWLGELLGKLYYGFFCVAAFYAIVWAFIQLIMYNIIKKRAANAIISQILN